MSYKVGIWIDHKKAVIVSASADSVSSKTLESEVGQTADASRDVRGEKKSEHEGKEDGRHYSERSYGRFLLDAL